MIIPYKEIKDTEFGGERPLFQSWHIHLQNVTIHAGESALKECDDIKVSNCRFEGKYPFWHLNDGLIEDCIFTEGARAAIWYVRNLTMKHSQVDAPKMFREVNGLTLLDVKVPDAQETLWHCDNVTLQNVEVHNADYIFMHCNNIRIKDYLQNGNYSFQYCRDVEIRNAVINSKDAFWNAVNVTIYDSEINGEYLGWHSKNLRLVNCRISGTQPLCYCTNLVLENCEIAPDGDLAFERSTVNAKVTTPITSVKNPDDGLIVAPTFGEIIITDISDCKIFTEQGVSAKIKPEIRNEVRQSEQGVSA